MTELEHLLNKQHLFLYADKTSADSLVGYAQTIVSHMQYRIATYRHKQMTVEADILEEELQKIIMLMTQWQEAEG